MVWSHDLGIDYSLLRIVLLSINTACCEAAIFERLHCCPMTCSMDAEQDNPELAVFTLQITTVVLHDQLALHVAA